MAPSISVIIPTHNRPELLREALETVRAQTFQDFEVIVVSSNERPVERSLNRETCEAFGYTFIPCDRGHVATARNVGAEAAKGEWYAFLDDDDIWLPQKLEKQLAAAQEFNAHVVVCDYTEFDHEGIVAIRRHRLRHRKNWTAATSYSSWWCTPSATLIRADAFWSVHGFCEWLRYGEDNDLWRRLSWNHRFHQMSQVLTRYRHGSEHASMTQQSFPMKAWHLVHLIKMRFDTPPHRRKDLPPIMFIVGWLAFLATRSKALRYIVWKIGLNHFGHSIVSRFTGA